MKAVIATLLVCLPMFALAADDDKPTDLEYARAESISARRQTLDLQIKLIDIEQRDFMATLAKAHAMGPQDRVDWDKRTIVRAPKKEEKKDDKPKAKK